MASLSLVRGPSALAASRPGRARSVAVRASADVPPHVAEARQWIANWRAKNNGAPAPAPAAAAASSGKKGKGKGGKAAVPVATPAAAPAGGRFSANASKDGSLVFTADQLQAVKWTDVKLTK